jgi:hypothetical protein
VDLGGDFDVAPDFGLGLTASYFGTIMTKDKTVELPLSPTDADKPMDYEIKIKGHLGAQWKDWFDGMSVTQEESNETVLSGLVVDQAALHGLLKKVRDLGLTLLSVNRTDTFKKMEK